MMARDAMASSVTGLRPTEPRERIVVLDVLRGFALFGVLVGNAFHLYSGMFLGDLGSYVPTKLDVVASWFVNLLVQSKAQTLLTFLFGFGFAAQLLRAQELGQPVLVLYARRMLVLLGFGILHVGLLWWGDVLWTYALAGFGLLAFHRASNRTRVVAAAILIVAPGAIMRLPGMSDWSYQLFYPANSFEAYAHDLGAAMRGTDHLAVMWQHIRFAPVFSAGLVFAYQPWLVGRVLLGQLAGALRWFDRDGADHLPVFRRMLFWGALAGTAGLAVVVLQMLGFFRGLPPSQLRRFLVGLTREMDYLGLAAAYLAAIVLLFQRARWRRVLSWLAPVGRMPLTVYLSQSLIMTCLLYGWGLGWNEVLTPAAYVGLSFAVFGLQMVACAWWLRRFRYGPLEWLWRTLVYMRRPPMRV
jgi:uncharacterized protein